MNDDIQLPKEGLSTIGAQFTKAAMEKVVGAVQKLKKEGWAEDQILLRMREELTNFPRHTIHRLYNIAVENPVDDDFQAEDVEGERVIKEHTVEFSLRRPIPEIESGCIVRFRESDWYVASRDKTVYTLKKLI